jgi:hypothetical protein
VQRAATDLVSGHRADRHADAFQCLHDVRLVWPPEIQGLAHLAVPANRIGSAAYTTAELKTIQEVITLTVFAAFSVLYLNEPLSLNHAVGFALIVAGAYFIFRGPL